MMRVFVCSSCRKVRVVSKYLKADCHFCSLPMKIIDVPYVKWVDFNLEQRTEIIAEFCAKE